MSRAKAEAEALERTKLGELGFGLGLGLERGLELGL